MKRRGRQVEMSVLVVTKEQRQLLLSALAKLPPSGEVDTLVTTIDELKFTSATIED